MVTKFAYDQNVGQDRQGTRGVEMMDGISGRIYDNIRHEKVIVVKEGVGRLIDLQGEECSRSDFTHNSL